MMFHKNNFFITSPPNWDNASFFLMLHLLTLSNYFNVQSFSSHITGTDNTSTTGLNSVRFFFYNSYFNKLWVLKTIVVNTYFWPFLKIFLSKKGYIYLHFNKLWVLKTIVVNTYFCTFLKIFLSKKGYFDQIFLLAFKNTSTYSKVKPCTFFLRQRGKL